MHLQQVRDVIQRSRLEQTACQAQHQEPNERRSVDSAPPDKLPKLPRRKPNAWRPRYQSSLCRGRCGGASTPVTAPGSILVLRFCSASLFASCCCSFAQASPQRLRYRRRREWAASAARQRDALFISDPLDCFSPLHGLSAAGSFPPPPQQVIGKSLGAGPGASSTYRLSLSGELPRRESVNQPS